MPRSIPATTAVASTRNNRKRTREIPANEASMFIKHGDVLAVTTVKRKKTMYVFMLSSEAPRVKQWKQKKYLIPSYAIFGTYCLGVYWIVEVRHLGYRPNDCEYRFTNYKKGASGRGPWSKSASSALKIAYKRTEKKEMKGSQNGKAEVGVFSEAMRSILAAFYSCMLSENDVREFRVLDIVTVATKSCTDFSKEEVLRICSEQDQTGDGYAVGQFDQSELLLLNSDESDEDSETSDTVGPIGEDQRRKRLRRDSSLTLACDEPLNMLTPMSSGSFFKYDVNLTF